MPGEPESYTFLGLTSIFHSERMRQLLSLVRKIAASDVTVLIEGESGTGKEIIARALHHFSLRHNNPWVDINCGVLPDHLVESELFGYERGAFSGADTSREGLFELAHTGTILLDEIGELDPKLQVKLLRVLDGIPYYRVGGRKKIGVDVRVVASTNVNLEQAVSRGEFRKDLFHRLNQFRITVPPLRERAEDIPVLAEYFVTQCRPDCRVGEEAMRILSCYPWPGNVRELKNAVTAAALLASEERLGVENLPEAIRRTPCQENLPGRPLDLETLERKAILHALAYTQGDNREAADLLGISLRTLSRKLKLYEESEHGVECENGSSRVCAD